MTAWVVSSDNKSLKLGLPYFFRQRIHGKDSSGDMLKLVKPESEGQRTENVIEDILRRADDGGQMMDVDLRTAQFYSPAEASWSIVMTTI